jgi:hypothetical protein
VRPTRLLLAAAAAFTVLLPAAPARAAYADAGVSTDVVTVPMVFPVLGATSYVDTFLACRSGCTRRHFGQDLMGPKMRPLVAAFTGYVSSVKRETTVGEGNYVTIKGDNGWSANYLHVNNDTPGTDDGKGTAQYAFAPGIRPGKRVFAGELLGWSGDSGNAESTGPHLHFELRRGDAWSGTVYNAFSSLNHAGHLAAPRTSGPHAEGTYVKGCATCSVYEVRNGKRSYLRPEVMAQRNVTSAMAVVVQPAEIAWLPAAPYAQLPGGRAYQLPDGSRWLVTNRTRIRIPDAAALALLGIAPDHVRAVSAAALGTVPPAPAGTPLPATPRYDGLVLRAAGTWNYFLIDRGTLRPIPDSTVMASWGLRGMDSVTFWPEQAAVEEGFPPPGAPLPLHDGRVVRDAHAHLFLVTNGTRRALTSAVSSLYAYDKLPVLSLPDTAVARLPQAYSLP